MTYLLAKSADALRSFGLAVVEEPGWLACGHGDMEATIRGVLCHHTAGPATGDAPSLPTVVAGRGGADPIPGPLANWFLSRSGTWHAVAAGKAYHAGYGELDGHLGTFNASLIGVEAENRGDGTDPWPEAQVDAYARGCAAFAKLYGFDAVHVLGHKEYARPAGRKVDPDFDMAAFRAKVSAALAAQQGGEAA